MLTVRKAVEGPGKGAVGGNGDSTRLYKKQGKTSQTRSLDSRLSLQILFCSREPRRRRSCPRASCVLWQCSEKESGPKNGTSSSPNLHLQICTPLGYKWLTGKERGRQGSKLWTPWKLLWEFSGDSHGVSAVLGTPGPFPGCWSELAKSLPNAQTQSQSS